MLPYFNILNNTLHPYMPIYMLNTHTLSFIHILLNIKHISARDLLVIKHISARDLLVRKKKKKKVFPPCKADNVTVQIFVIPS